MNKKELFSRAIDNNARAIITMKNRVQYRGIANWMDESHGVIFNAFGEIKFKFDKVSHIELIINNPF